MWRYIGVLSLLLLPCTIQGGYEKLPPCPEDKVCAIFYDGVCNRPGVVGGPIVTGIIFDSLTECAIVGETPIIDFTSKWLYGRIDIKVIDAYTWTIVTTHYGEITNSKYTFKVVDPPHPILSFSGTNEEATAIFTWEGKSKQYKMKHLGYEDSKYVNEFTLSLAEEKLKIFDVIGEQIRYYGKLNKNKNFGDVNPGAGFAEKLRALTPCPVSDLHEADPCVGECKSLKQLNLTGPVSTDRICSNTLWYHNKDEDPESKSWAKVNGVTCNIGNWELDKGDGASEKVGDSLEFQCSEFTPTHPFPMGAKIGLAIGGGIGLLVIMGVIGFFIWRHFERKDAKTASAMGIVTGFRPQDLPKGYLDKPKSMRNDHPIGSARTPGDEGTQKEKDAGTPASPADTPTPDSKV